jgi:hypothetical protein
LETETTYPATAEGLRDAAREIAENVTSTETLARSNGEPLEFEDFLRKVWKSRIEFQKLYIAKPEPLPIGPSRVIGDNVGFTRAA